VKLQGNRFDLTEVGAVLRSHPSVREAAVFAIATASGLGDKEVCAAVQADASLINDPRFVDDLRRLCRDSLPNFARPTRILVLTNLPLLSSGKIDRKEMERQLHPN
jgi:acyl-coenzyme A synthetase/AMP-(fatty) acid ligase